MQYMLLYVFFFFTSHPIKIFTFCFPQSLYCQSSVVQGGVLLRTIADHLEFISVPNLKDP